MTSQPHLIRTRFIGFLSVVGWSATTKRPYARRISGNNPRILQSRTDAAKACSRQRDRIQAGLRSRAISAALPYSACFQMHGPARCGLERARMKIASFNINNIKRRLPNLLAWLRRGQARRRLPAGAQGDRCASFPPMRCERAGYECGLARAEDLERRRHPRARRDADPDPQRAAGRRGRHAEPLHRGGGQRRAHRLALCAERQPAAGPEIRLQARLARSPRRACRRALRRRRAGRAGRRLQRGADRAATSIRPSPGTTTRCCSRRAARPFGACSRRAGSTRSARCIRTSRCTRSGITCGTAGSATPGLRLDHLLLSADLAARLVELPASTATCAARTTPATMRRSGSSCAMPRAVARRAARQITARRPRRRRRARRAPPSERRTRRPLLVIDGDSFAHRSYHALPKTILRRGKQGRRRHRRLRQLPAAALRDRAAARRAGRLGHARRADLSARAVSRLSERARVRRRAASSSSTRCRSSSPPAASPMPRRRATRPTISSPPRSPPRSGAAAPRWSRAATATRSSSPPTRPRSSIRCAPARWRASARRRCASAMASSPRRCRISSRCAAIPSDKLPGAAGVGPQGRRRSAAPLRLARSRARGRPLCRRRRRSCGSIARSPPWTAAAPLPPLADQAPTWAKASALAREWELNRLADRLAEMGARAGRK